MNLYLNDKDINRGSSGNLSYRITNGFVITPSSVPNDKLNEKINFFHLGKDNDWKKLLDLKTTKEIESKFSKEMKELGYL